MKMICDFCYRHCNLAEGMKGWCRSRIASGGIIRDAAYGHLAAIADDPIEKKPLYHFLPGTRTLSIAMEGCSLDCDFCQNFHIAKGHHDNLEFHTPESIAGFAAENGYESISFTYTEPIVWQDYMLETAKEARKHSIKTVMVSNGTFSDEALDRILPAIDAYNIDLKGDAQFYSSVCHGSIEPVLDGIGRIVEYGSHLEVTTLVIEGIRTKTMIRELGRMLRKMSVKVWHITPFYPMRRMAEMEATSRSFLMSMADEAMKTGIPHVYALDDSLKCPECGKRIRRQESNGICPECGTAIYGVWKIQDPTA